MNLKKLEKKIIIVCGGKGKRLGKITKTTPKPLIKIGNKTIIEHKISYYKSQGINKFIFCTGYKGNLIKKFLIKKIPNAIFDNAGLNVGILKRIFSIKNHIKDNIIISYGDTLAKINFKDLISKHKKSKCLLTIVVAPIQNPFGLVNWNNRNKVISFHEKPILNHYIGYAVFSPKLFNKIENRIVNLSDGKGIIECIKYLIKKKQVNSYKLKNLQITINSPEELKYARLNYKKYFTF
tara:strand:+ start:2630 stop:3340 length:711 start_codon:yes stop_codon:yes gene_type:complete